MKEPELCAHLIAIDKVKIGESHVCEECIKNNSRWVHLRTCQTCYAKLCCDDSSNKHMTKHFHATHHPVIASAERGERWLWCYPDEKFLEY